MTSYLDYPFRFDERGRTATTGSGDHIQDMIRQVLFTSPGERVNRPTFGCGLLELVFTPNSAALAVATQAIVHGALQRWLGDLINVEQVRILSEDARLIIDIVYVRRDTNQRQQDRYLYPANL